MTTAYVLLVPGTSETHDADKPLPPVGMTALVSDRLPTKVGDIDIVCWSVPYTSGYGDKASYLDSVNNGKKNLRRILRLLPVDSLVFLVGYSQGCTIAGDITRDWGIEAIIPPPTAPQAITAYYGISDPRRNGSDIVGPDPGGCGITGERGPWGKAVGRIYQFCAPGDIIASSDPRTDLFMEASKFTNKFWVGDVLGWIGYTLGVLNSKEFQTKLRLEYGYKGLFGWLEFGSKLKRTIERGSRYLISNVHTSYGSYKVDGKVVPHWIASDILSKIKEHQS